MLKREFKASDVLMWRLPHGADLLDGITGFAGKEGITMGTFFAIGAVSEAVIGFYDQVKKQYGDKHIDQPMEIVSCTGNISLRDDKPAVHAHIVLSDEDGKTLGGHLMPGTVIFACEATVFRLEGEPLHRGHDDVTGLPLWREDNG